MDYFTPIQVGCKNVSQLGEINQLTITIVSNFQPDIPVNTHVCSTFLGAKKKAGEEKFV